MGYYNGLSLSGARPAPRSLLGTAERPAPINTAQPCYCVRFHGPGTQDQYTLPVASSAAAYQERARLKRSGMGATVLRWDVREQLWVG